MADNIPSYPSIPNLVNILGIDTDTFRVMQESGLNIEGIVANNVGVDDAIDTYYDPYLEYGARTDDQRDSANEGEGRRNLSANPNQPGVPNPLTVRNYTANYKPGDILSMAPANFEEGSEYTEVPTATSNPAHPRTVAAAYNREETKLTIMFFDGTLYNYYSVSPEEWDNFKTAQNDRGELSKGQYIKDTLDQKARGFANIEELPEDVRMLARTLARGVQVAAARKRGWTPPASITPRAPKVSKTPKPIKPNFGTGRRKTII